jgi:hypothetical protein
MQHLLAPIGGQRDDWRLADAYASSAEAFRDGWDAPAMSDYDEYARLVQ